jgi:hypothetical protein
MFDLNEEIAAWKSGFSGQRACSQDELDELESHLREEIDLLVGRAVTESDAFAEAAARIGAPRDVCGEFAKNERLFRLDKLALGVNKVLILLMGVAALALAAVLIREGDALLGVHVASTTFAYVVASLSSLIGTYAIVRSVRVKEVSGEFRDQLAQQCRRLLGLTFSMTAIGFVLGACWAHREWGHFVEWNLREIGAMTVFGVATVFYLIVTRQRLGTMRLGQVALTMSFVTLVSWFGPNMFR